LLAHIAQSISQSFEPEMIYIPGGEFLMGSDPQRDPDAYKNEQPQHSLYLTGYYIAKTPVTNAQYMACVKANGCDHPKHWVDGQPPRGKENHPVVNVSWHDAMAYCRRLSELSGQPYTLPSEPEWEKAARGSDGRIYPWGDRWDGAKCNSRENGRMETTPVDAYPLGASPYGLLDCAGNVLEWTISLWGGWDGELARLQFGYPYDCTDGREDTAADDDIFRVLRGGCWQYVSLAVRCAYRSVFYPPARHNVFGFRCCVK